MADSGYRDLPFLQSVDYSVVTISVLLPFYHGLPLRHGRFRGSLSDSPLSEKLYLSGFRPNEGH